MARGKALDGKAYAGNPHVRFDEGEAAQVATPGHGSLLYGIRRVMATAACVAAPILGMSADFYVDCLLGHDSYAGTSAKPKKTIQAAVNVATAGDRIYVAPGMYTPFNMDRQLTVIGTKGAHRTFIDGGNKYRCARFADIEGYELRGFTLQNGYAGKDHGGGAWNGVLRNCVVKDCRTFDGNGAFGGGGVYRTHLYDCIIEGCHAGFGGAMHEGLAYRCTFRKNYAWNRGGAIWGATVHHSLIHDNWCHNYGGQPGGAGAHGAWLYNCTITRNEVRRLAGAGGLHGCYSYNCIVWNNRNPAFPAYAQYCDHRARHDHYNTDPRFVAPDRFDFHLRHDSPCRRIADRTHLPDWANVQFDRDRNPRFHGSTLDMGCYEEDEELNSVKPNGDGTYQIKYNPMGEEFVSVSLDGITQISSATNGVFIWQPQTLGMHTNIFTYGLSEVTNVTHVTAHPFDVQKEPVPPMALDNDVVITPLTRNVKQTGASYSVTTTGSTANWQAAVSDDWISLTATDGEAGFPVAYMVGMNTNAETRVGYIYVSGHVHTITQAGVGSTLDKGNAQFESEGGEGTIALTIDQRHIWKARPNVDWISVSPTNGMSNGTITYTVAPLYDVTTRSGTITAGGNTFTVFQYGRRIGLGSYSETRDYYTHVIPITVNALAITEWEVAPNNSWISIVDGGKGKGADLVTIAISENPSFQARTGTVTIGTETFRVTQEGRTDVEFAINPVETTGSANGANGLIAITATPDMPWVAESQNNWLTIVPSYATGAGNGNVAYTVNPNTTVYDRTGTIVITPDQASGLPTYTHTVHQPAANVALSHNGYEFSAPGESVGITVTVSKNVQWSVEGAEDIDWLSVNGATTYIGPATVTLAASANDSIYPRSGTITIAGKSFAVSQKGRGVEIDYESIVFDTEGGWDSISVHPDGDVEWTAVSSDPTWITITAGGSGSGDGEVIYTISDYIGDGGTRTGTITIGDKVVTIVQTAYPVSISPTAETVAGNAGEGEISVSADIEAVWNAIATEPWITIVSGYDAGTGSGTVRFTFTENATGKTRTGKIAINGTEYTLTQQSRTLVAVNGEVDGHGGTIANAGSYDLGASVTIEAIPDAGYVFSYWTLPDGTESMVNPLTVRADVAKTYTAKFAPNTPELTSVVSGTDGVALNWNNLPWALKFHIWRGSSNVPAEAIEIDVIENNASGTYLDTTGEIGLAYFYWIEAEGATDRTISSEAKAGTRQKPIIVSNITYKNLKGATHANPASYTEETSVVFTPPTSTVTGYTFAGWSPISIGTDMKGDVIVRANWTANGYNVVYNPNGGSGTIDATPCTYDEYATIAENGFVWADHIFMGWATEENGEVIYQAGDSILNLSAAQNGLVTLYAVWEVDPESLVVAEPVITPADGSIFKTETCTVTITCATSEAQIYYTTNGRTPSAQERYRYTGPFTISGTTTITAFAVGRDALVASDYVEATITYVEPVPLTWKGVLDEEKLASVTTGGEADWQMVEADDAKVGDSYAASGVVADDDEAEHTTYIKVKVYGQGTLTFWWRVDCESDPRGRFTYDHGKVEADGELVDRKDGQTGWLSGSIEFTTDGEHEIVWTYTADGYAADGGEYANRMWVDGLSWSGSVPDVPSVPSVSDDPDATVTGDAENGYTIKPSANNTAVEVTIPDGVDASKVTVAISTFVETIKANGANIKVMKGAYDITSFLDIPAANAGGVIDMTKADVKQSVANEAMDTSKGAEIDLGDSTAPLLTTSATKPGLTYTLREGRTLKTMANSATKQGDGQPWTPTITVKGGTSGFYTIKVEK